MKLPLSDPRVDMIVAYVSARKDGASLREIVAQIAPPAPIRTVQFWVASLVEISRLRSKGAARATRYFGRNGATLPSTSASLPVLPSPNQSVVKQTRPDPVRASIGATKVAPEVQPTPTAPATHDPKTVPSARPIRQKTTGKPNEASAGISNEPVPTPAPVTPPSPPPAPPMDPRFQEALDVAIPEIVRSRMLSNWAESRLRGEGVHRNFDHDQAYLRAFVSAGMAELKSLTLANAARYKITPEEWKAWRAQWM